MGRNGGAASRGACGPRRAAIGVRAARRGRVRASDRVRQRRCTVARGRPRPAPGDCGPPGDWLGSAPSGSAAADRGPGDGRDRGSGRHVSGLVGRRRLRADRAGGDRKRSQQLRRPGHIRRAGVGCRCVVIRARGRVGYHIAVRARASARGFAFKPCDGAQGRRPRRRPRQPHAIDAGRQRSGPRVSAAYGIGAADRKLRAHPKPADWLRVRQRPDVLGAASRLTISTDIRSRHGGPPAHTDPGGAWSGIGCGQSLRAVQRMFENDPLPSRSPGRSRERPRRGTALRVVGLLSDARHSDPGRPRAHSRRSRGQSAGRDRE